MENKSKESQLQSDDKKEKIIPLSAFPYIRKIKASAKKYLNIPEKYKEKEECVYCVPDLSYYDKEEKCIMIPLFTTAPPRAEDQTLVRIGIPREVIMDCIRDNE